MSNRLLRRDSRTPTLDLNFLAMNETTFDKRITFSRTSHATMFDATGKLTFAPNNLLLRSNTFSTTWTTTSSTVTVNGTLPSGGDAWKLAASTTNTAPAVVQDTSSITTIDRFIRSVVAKKGEANFLLISAGNNPVNSGAWFNLDTGAVGTVQVNASASIQSLGSGWYRCAVKVTTDGGAPNEFRIRATQSDNSTTWSGVVGDGIFIGEAQFERVTYETSPRPYNATTSAAYYGPRLEYDPVTLAAKGLLVEEARTNSVFPAETFTVTWSLMELTAVADQVTAPDGISTSADLARPTTANSFHRIRNTNSVSTAAATMSIFVKPNGYTEVGLRESTTTGASVVFTLTGAGTVKGTHLATATSASGTITALPDGWYRISATFTFSGATNQGLGLYITNGTWASGDVESLSFAGDGTSGVYVWGAQLEAGSFPTSYIPTTTASVTRAVDACIISVSNGGFVGFHNKTHGTYVTESVWEADGDDDTVYMRTSSTGIYRVGYYISNAIRSDVVAGGSLSVSSAVTTRTGAVRRAGLSYSPSQAVVSAAGGSIGMAAHTNSPTIDRMCIGSLGGAGNHLGYVRRIRYWPFVLGGAEIRALSSNP